jgi:hypothetical protein
MADEIAGREASSSSTRRTVLSTAAGLALLSVGGRATIATMGAHDRRETDPDFASAVDAAKLIRQRKVGSRELTGRMLERITKFNPKLNAVVNVLSDQSLAEARHADEAQARGDPADSRFRSSAPLARGGGRHTRQHQCSLRSE